MTPKRQEAGRVHSQFALFLLVRSVGCGTGAGGGPCDGRQTRTLRRGLCIAAVVRVVGDDRLLEQACGRVCLAVALVLRRRCRCRCCRGRRRWLELGIDSSGECVEVLACVETQPLPCGKRV